VLNVPEGVDVRKVDLSIELQILAFHAQRRSAVRPEAEPVGGQRGAHQRGAHPGAVNGMRPASSRPPVTSELAAQA
jgi:redox-sensing transcriptional repressor